MSENKYLVLVGSTNGVRPITGNVVDFVRGYIQSDIFKHSYHQFGYRNQVLIESPVNNLEITGICKETGQLIRGNAVVAIITGNNIPKLSGMDLKLAEVAREEVFVVSKMVEKNV